VEKTLEDGNTSHVMNWQNQYCENGCITNRNLQIQCNSYQNPNDVLYRNRKKNPKIHMEAQKNMNRQSNLKKKKNAGGITIPDFK
jgi:hypothetical protein